MMRGAGNNRYIYFTITTACLFFILSFCVFCDVSPSPVAVSADQTFKTSVSGITTMHVSKAPIVDYGHITGKVLNIQSKREYPVNTPVYAKVKIIKISSMAHDKRAGCYTVLKQGDIIECLIQLGLEKVVITSAGEYMEGLKKGDLIEFDISGCPKECGCGNGWVLNKYQIVR